MSDVKPFVIHAQRSPKCAFVRSILFDDMTPKSLTINLREMNSALMNDKKPSKHQKIEATQQIRKRTFSHWPHRTSPSSQQMIEAGFFNCNVGDRVICLYCNLICQKSTPHTDDPCQMHKTLSPKCSYVISMLENQPISSVHIINEQAMIDSPIMTTNNNTCLNNKIVDPAICHTNYTETSMCHASFGHDNDEDDEVTFSSPIRSRLDLSISQNLIAQGFHLSIIKRCYKDQFDLKHDDDFTDDSDRLVACMILQKQIEHIDNKKENIIISDIKINEIHLREQTDICSSTYIGWIVQFHNLAENLTHASIIELSG
ncbi:unnamed protein product [Rotaria sordida]|uniref:Uncharacterized protein n=1 Tax=Rotaria sordida TaxID=392033 RepID=A0A819FGV1_9BILA|nr:unnamed protein product [Rotaria sordida]CAF3868439.1 unnamed protein product [Rotaria sordida]CAF3965980.1 unnamed protein product [Rotaria sordida]